MANVRGSAIQGTFDYLCTTFGETALARVLAALSPETRAAIAGDTAVVITTGWYDARHLIELSTRADALLGAGDLALARAAGRHVAFADVNRFFKWLLRLSGPTAILSRAAAVWKNYHSDGTYVFEGTQGTRASIRIEGYTSPDPVMCRRVEGWIERAMEISLGASVQVKIHEESHLARTDGSPQRYCRFVAEWHE